MAGNCFNIKLRSESLILSAFHIQSPNGVQIFIDYDHSDSNSDQKHIFIYECLINKLGAVQILRMHVFDNF